MMCLGAVGLLKVKIGHIKQVTLALGTSALSQGYLYIQTLVGYILTDTGVRAGTAGLLGTSGVRSKFHAVSLRAYQRDALYIIKAYRQGLCLSTNNLIILEQDRSACGHLQCNGLAAL